MKIEITKDFRTLKKGTIVDIDPVYARDLIYNQKVAKKCEEKKTTKPKK